MALSAVIPQAPPDSYSLGEFLTGIEGLKVYFKTARNPPLPGGPAGIVLNIRVPGTERGEKLVNLAIIAEMLGVQETKINGGLAAQRRFGPFLLEAHVLDADTAGAAA